MLQTSCKLLFSIIVILELSCSSVNTEKVAIQNAAANTKWKNEWQRISGMNSSTLTISGIMDDSMKFSFSASSGGNSGELEGLALAIGDTASYIERENGDSCLIGFILTKDSTISVKQTGDCGAGMGVFYSGIYKVQTNDSSSTDTARLFNPVIFKTDKQDSVFRKLTGKYYPLFIQSTQLTAEEDDLDNLHVFVYVSNVRGLATEMENIIMIDSLNNIWAAVIDNQKVFYFTNSAAFRNKLPQTIDKWRERFKEYQVIFK